MKTAIFYFSGTGITRWAVESFTKMMESKGHESLLLSIDQKETWFPEKIKTALEGASSIGIAYPIYGADMPPIMHRFVDMLSSNRMGCKDQWPLIPAPPLIKAFTICTAMAVNGFGPFLAARVLKKARLSLNASINIRITSNASVPGLKSNPPAVKVIEARKEKALRQLDKFADYIISGRKHITGVGPYLLAGYGIRRFFGPQMKDNYKNFSVDMFRCIKCLICVNHCPTRSIVFTGRSFQFKETCTACMRCYNYCSPCAIFFKGQYADPHEYVRFHGLD